jgi:hypothetical protein
MRDLVGTLFAEDLIPEDKAVSLEEDLTAALTALSKPPVRPGVLDNVKIVVEKYLAQSNWGDWERKQEHNMDWLTGKIDFFTRRK